MGAFERYSFEVDLQKKPLQPGKAVEWKGKEGVGQLVDRAKLKMGMESSSWLTRVKGIIVIVEGADERDNEMLSFHSGQVRYGGLGSE